MMDKTQMSLYKMQNQLQLVHKADKYVDIDQKIYENYIERKQQTGWAKSRISAAKIPPSVLYGFNPTATSSNAAKTTHGSIFNMKAHMTAYSGHLPPKSKTG